MSTTAPKTTKSPPVRARVRVMVRVMVRVRVRVRVRGVKYGS